MQQTRKNILLLGGNGFLGRNLTGALVGNEAFGVSVYDLSEPEEKLDGVSYHTGSLDETEKICSIMDKEKTNVLIHMISTIVPGSSIEQYIRNCQIVQQGTIPLMDYCARNGVELVFFSSGGAVYGVKGGVISENEPVAPISYYGLSKIQIEDLINFYHRRYGLNYLILRPSNPYGHGQNLYGRQGLIAVILGRILKGESITVFGDGEVVRDYIYIDDFTYYVSELIKKGILNETINIGSGVGYTINQIVEAVDEVAETPIKVEHIAARKDDVPKLVLDTTRLHNFVHHDNVPLREGIRRFYDSVMEEH